MHDFEMLEQRKEIENQLAISADMRQKSKLDSKIQSLRDAQEQGQLTEKETNDEILRLELGIPGSQSPLFRKITGKDELAKQFAATLRDRETGGVAPEQTNTTALFKLANLSSTSKEDREDIKTIIAAGDPTQIKIALDSMEAKKRTGILGRESGVFFGKPSTKGGNRPYRPTLFSPALNSF